MARRWLAFALLIGLIGLLVALRGAGSADSPEHSSASDARNGTSALRYYAQSLGYTASTIEGEFSLPSSKSLLFVFTPVDGFSFAQAQQLQRWVAAGDVVVYAAEDGDPDLDNQFAVRRSAATVNAAARLAAPVLGGVDMLSGASAARSLRPSAAQVPLLRNAAGDVLGIRVVIGSGVLIVLTDPLLLCNGYLGLADNGRFAADLLAMTPAGGSVLFDEYHHGAAAGASTAIAWIGTAWGAALGFAVLVVFLGLALRGRAFGPTVSLENRPDRSGAEYAAAVGSLLHRTGARSITLETLRAATRRALAAHIGLSSQTPSEQVGEALAQRAPAAAGELAAIETVLARPTASEDDVLAIARRLHALAYPPATAQAAKGDRR